MCVCVWGGGGTKDMGSGGGLGGGVKEWGGAAWRFNAGT